MSLIAKQKRFCEEYIIDLNGTQAAIRAGYASNSANEQAARMLAKDSIQEYIQQLKADRSRRTEITADRVLQELAAVAFAKIDDFLKVEEITHIEYVPVNEPAESEDDEDSEAESSMTTKPVERKYKVVNIYETEKVDRGKLPAIASIKQTKDGIELKTHDKIKSLELLGRHLGMWNDKLDLSTKGESLNDKRPSAKLPDGTILEI